MAYLSDLESFNRHRQETFRIQTAVGESVLITRLELNNVIESLIGEDLARIVAKLSIEQKNDLEGKVKHKLDLLENELTRLINDRIDKITEKVVGDTIGRIVEDEVNKRLAEKIEQINKTL